MSQAQPTELLGCPVVVAERERLRYTRKGWMRFGFAFVSGTHDLRTGRDLPDRYGCFRQEVWIGPFASAREALQPLP